jgi:hypothetical protein
LQSKCDPKAVGALALAPALELESIYVQRLRSLTAL